jgi:hypothetical protein
VTNVPVLVHVAVDVPQGHSLLVRTNDMKTKKITGKQNMICNIVLEIDFRKTVTPVKRDLEVIEKRAKQTAKDARKVA